MWQFGSFEHLELESNIAFEAQYERDVAALHQHTNTYACWRLFGATFSALMQFTVVPRNTMYNVISRHELWQSLYFFELVSKSFRISLLHSFSYREREQMYQSVKTQFWLASQAIASVHLRVDVCRFERSTGGDDEWEPQPIFWQIQFIKHNI